MVEFAARVGRKRRVREFLDEPIERLLSVALLPGIDVDATQAQQNAFYATGQARLKSQWEQQRGNAWWQNGAVNRGAPRNTGAVNQ